MTTNDPNGWLNKHVTFPALGIEGEITAYLPAPDRYAVKTRWDTIFYTADEIRMLGVIAEEKKAHDEA